MFTTVSVQLPHPVLLQLIAHLEKHGGPKDLSAVMQAAWSDLSVRRPGDKKWTVASRLRRELALEQGRAELAAAPPAVAAVAPALPPAPASEPSEPPAPRRVEVGPEWSLPERRGYVANFWHAKRGK